MLRLQRKQGIIFEQITGSNLAAFCPCAYFCGRKAEMDTIMPEMDRDDKKYRRFHYGIL